MMRVTPFHFRAADANAQNLWLTRNDFTVAALYNGVREEALAARFGVAMGDISWRWRLVLEGARAGEFLGYLTSREGNALAPGQAHRALWLTDGGAVRGAGLVARQGVQSFLLSGDAPDREWVATAASLFAVSLRDVTGAEGGLAIVGPYARSLLTAAGLETGIAPLSFAVLPWNGLEVTLLRSQQGYELWCKADDAPIVWDRLLRAGGPFALRPAGLAALDVLEVEGGILRAGRDYAPATDGHAVTPTPGALGLESLIDADHGFFNGREAWNRAYDSQTVTGIELESAICAPHAALYAGARLVGQVLTCVYSPALRHAVGFARLDHAYAAPGMLLTLTPPPSRDDAAPRPVTALVRALPFLPPPDTIG